MSDINEMKDIIEDFREDVLERLDAIEGRLASIEGSFTEATSFADGILAGESIFDAESINGLKDMFSSVLPMTGAAGNDETPVDLEGLIGSLKDLKSELTGLNTKITSDSEKE